MFLHSFWDLLVVRVVYGSEEEMHLEKQLYAPEAYLAFLVCRLVTLRIMLQKHI